MQPRGRCLSLGMILLLGVSILPSQILASGEIYECSKTVEYSISTAGNNVTNPTGSNWWASIYFYNESLYGNDDNFTVVNGKGCLTPGNTNFASCQVFFKFKPVNPSTFPSTYSTTLRIAFTYSNPALNRVSSITVNGTCDSERYIITNLPEERTTNNPVCSISGSIINPSNRTVIEEIPIVGVPFSLQYNSRLSSYYETKQGKLNSTFGYNQEAWVPSIYKFYDLSAQMLFGGAIIGGVTGYITQKRLNPNSSFQELRSAAINSAVITAGAAGLAASGAGLIAGAAAELGGLSYSFLNAPGDSGTNAADLYNGANTLLNPNKSKQNGACGK